MRDFFNVYDYIDQNPVKSGLVPNPTDWKACGAYYIVNNIGGFVDFTPFVRMSYIKLLKG